MARRGRVYRLDFAIFAGSGKTHTCFGTSSEPGLVQMLAEELFARLEQLPPGTTFTATLGMLEIYNER